MKIKTGRIDFVSIAWNIPHYGFVRILGCGKCGERQRSLFELGCFHSSKDKKDNRIIWVLKILFIDIMGDD
jgi:hypothetical protein